MSTTASNILPFPAPASPAPAAPVTPPPPAPAAPPPPDPFAGYPPPCTDRDETIARIRAALKRRTGRPWSVTGGKGTAWGWIRIDAPPARRTWRSRPLPHNPGGYLPGKENWEDYDSGEPGGYMSPAERAELGAALGLDHPAHHQGVQVAASGDYRTEYVDRAEGRPPRCIAQPYWD